jgi:hypothetical protein
MASAAIYNKTLDPVDLRDPRIAPTARSLRRWVWRWLLAGQPLGVNGAVKRRCYIRWHKLWEYARGLALTGTSIPARPPGATFSILDVGGAMTAPLFYLAGRGAEPGGGGGGDRVVSLDIDHMLVDQTNRIACRLGLSIDARTNNLAREDLSAADLGARDIRGFDRAFCFCVIEHIPAMEQAVVARRIAGLLKPGGRMCLTFDFGEHAPTEAPLHTPAHVEAIRQAVGLPLMNDEPFTDSGGRYALNRRAPDAQYTFGSLFFCKP